MRRSLRKVTVVKVLMPRVEALRARSKTRRRRKVKGRAVMLAPMRASLEATQKRIASFQKLKTSLPLKRRSSSLIVVDKDVLGAQEVAPRNPSHPASSSKLR